jgi:alkylresorcinol/alkylpyrone synthase
MVSIVAVQPELPPHRYTQEEITREIGRHLSPDSATNAVLERVHQATGVQTRYLALPLEQYRELDSFTHTNELFAEHALPLVINSTTRALKSAGIDAAEVDYMFFTTVTGLGAPSLDVALHQALGFRSDLKRVPSFGLGCVAGASGIARAADYLEGHPDGVALVVSVELCSLTIQWDDPAMANLVGTGLFGDGAATVVMVGREHPKSRGPRVVGSSSSLYPDSSEMIGWRIGHSGFRLMLQAGVPAMIDGHFGSDARNFLGTHGREPADITVWLGHPGGPRILESFSEALGLQAKDLETSWEVLARVGNLSSAAILHVLAEKIEQPAGTQALLFALGPGVSAEMVLLEWPQ